MKPIFILLFSFILLAMSCPYDECQGYEGRFYPIKLNNKVNIQEGFIYQNKYFIKSNTADSIFNIDEFIVSFNMQFDELNQEKYIKCSNKVLKDTFINIVITDAINFNNRVANTDISDLFEIIDLRAKTKFSISDFISKYQFLSYEINQNTTYSRIIDNNICILFKLKEKPILKENHKFTFKIEYSQLVIDSTKLLDFKE